MPSSIASRLRTKLRHMTGSKRGKPVDITISGEGIVSYKINIEDEATAYIKRLVELANQGLLSDAAAEAVAEGLKDLVREEAGRFRHTGALMNSIHVTPLSMSRYAIDSDSPYAHTWTHTGDQGSPNTSDLLPWVRSRASFSGPSRFNRPGKDTSVTKEEVAFLIARSIREQRADVTGRSKLRKLGGGARMYDYPRVAMDRGEPMVHSIGAAFEEIL